LALGATNLRVWARFGHDHTSDADTRAEITTEIAGIAEHAANHGLTVGIECHGWTLTDTAESARRLVADIGADHVFSYWQPNYWDAEVNNDDDQQVAELELLHPDLSHLHVYWWYGLEDRRALREGSGTWVRALDVARRPNRWTADRYAFLEYVPGDDPELLTREATTLRDWLNQ
jgi:sugar phosphate isomerase/epimerase